MNHLSFYPKKLGEKRNESMNMTIITSKTKITVKIKPKLRELEKRMKRSLATLKKEKKKKKTIDLQRLRGFLGGWRGSGGNQGVCVCVSALQMELQALCITDVSAGNGHSPLRTAGALRNHCTGPSFQLQSFHCFI